MDKRRHLKQQESTKTILWAQAYTCGGGYLAVKSRAIVLMTNTQQASLTLSSLSLMCTMWQDGSSS